MVWGTIAAMSGSVASSLANRSESRHAAKQQFRYNEQLQKNDQEFQKFMAQNAHQYEIEDLKKAGLNPVLSAGGSSAGAIAGSSAGQGTGAGNTSANYQEAISNAIQAMTAQSGKELNKSQQELNQATKVKTMEEAGQVTPQAKAKIRALNSSSAKMEAEIGKINKEKELIETQKGLNSAKKIAQKGTKEYHKGLVTDAGEKYVKKITSKPYKEPTEAQRAKGYLY